MRPKVHIFDSTLRDGAQAKGISFSVADRLHMVSLLDDMGVDYIEAGNPTSNPKERAFFEEVKGYEFKHAKLVAFGATRYKGIKVEDDPGVQALLGAGTPVVAIFGKSWDLHVTEVIRATLDENLEMVHDTIAYFKKLGKEVIFDAEHFFDGYKACPEYALSVLKAANSAGADTLVLCDTNGGVLPWEAEAITQAVADLAPKGLIGIHAHNDSELAVANSLCAVKAGARHVQGTFIGFGERCGNARLTSIIPDLQLKMGYDCIPEDKLRELTAAASEAAEIANLAPNDKLPFVGKDAFAHKGGMHIDGVKKVSHSFEHVAPETVGNQRAFLLSEVAGRSAFALKLEKRFPQLDRNSNSMKELVDKLKDMEHEGYSFEGAESSFELLVHKHLGLYEPFFELQHYKVMDEPKSHDGALGAHAVVKIAVKGAVRIAAAEGTGPVDALDKALRSALLEFFPELEEVSLTDYKVRVLDTKSATEARVRVVIQSSDKKHDWTTLGVSNDVIQASLTALIDSIDYKLQKANPA